MKKDLKFIYYNSTSEYISIDKNIVFQTQAGRENLINKIVKGILTVKGSNQFDPRFGNSQTNLFIPITSQEEENLKTTIALSISSLKDDIKKAQALDNSLLSEEKLIDLTLVSTEFNSLLGTWNITISVKTQDGNTSIANI